MEASVIQVLGIVFTGITSTLIAVLNSNSRAARAEQKAADMQSKIQEEIDRLVQSVSATNDGLMDISASLQQFKAESIMSDEQLKKGILSMAKDCINSRHKKFLLKGYIDDNSKEALHTVYEVYKELGGNSFVETEMQDIDRLPVKPLVD